MEEEVGLELGGIYTGGCGVGHMCNLPMPFACFCPVGLWPHCSVFWLLGTLSSLGQGSLSPQKRRLTKPLTGVDLG